MPISCAWAERSDIEPPPLPSSEMSRSGLMDTGEQQ